jgi:hypothetical protein
MYNPETAREQKIEQLENFDAPYVQSKGKPGAPGELDV